MRVCERNQGSLARAGGWGALIDLKILFALYILSVGSNYSDGKIIILRQKLLHQKYKSFMAVADRTLFILKNIQNFSTFWTVDRMYCNILIGLQYTKLLTETNIPLDTFCG